MESRSASTLIAGGCRGLFFVPANGARNRPGTDALPVRQHQSEHRHGHGRGEAEPQSGLQVGAGEVDAEGRRDGDAAGDRERASRYFAANAFCAKSALALATGLSLPVLGLLGYQPGQPIDAGVGLSLAVVYALVPCVIKAVSAVWLFRILPVMDARH